MQMIQASNVYNIQLYAYRLMDFCLNIGFFSLKHSNRCEVKYSSVVYTTVVFVLYTTPFSQITCL